MRLAGITLALTFGLALHGFAVAAVPRTHARQLLLEVFINGYNQHLVVSVTERNNALLIPKGDLDDIGIRTSQEKADASGLIDISKLSGLTAKIDEAAQTLILRAIPGRLTPQIVDLRPPAAAFHRATSGTGLIVDYDSVATAINHGDALSAGANFQATGFTPWGALTATGFGTIGSGQNRFTRLDTAIEIDDQDALRQWVFGDAVSGGLSWSRAVRFAGLHVATDYSLEPELVTQPLPQFFGQTTVPASVDVFVNAAKVLETPIKPGPFEIRDLPVITGGGTAQIVVRDELGREITQSIPFYTTPRLLAPGLTAYSFDLGALRRSYGQRSFGYGNPVAEATLRYGLDDRLTLEAHAEATTGVFAGGGGVIFAVPPFGVMEASLAASHTKRGDGNLVSVLAQSQTHPLNLFASYTATSKGYADVGSVDAMSPPRQRIQAGVGLSLGESGSLALSWVDVRNRSGTPTRLATASYSLSLGDGLYFGVTGVDDVQSGQLSAQAFLSIPLGGGTYLGGSVRQDSSGTSGALSLTRPANPDGGFGYRVLASRGSQSTEEADATWIETHGRLDAGISSAGGRTAMRIGASGAAIVMDGALFTTHTSDDAFAVVRTGQPNVEVYHENRPIARSGDNGEALVPDLNAYESNHISVDPRDYPMNKIVTDPERIVVPRRHSGVTVDFSPPDLHPVRIVVRLEDGNFPPAGTPVQIEELKEPLVVGHRGAIFVEDLTRPLTARIPLESTWCEFQIVPPSRKTSDDEIPLLGPLTCRVENTNGP